MSEEIIKREFKIRNLTNKVTTLDMQLKNAMKQVNARIIKETADLEKKYNKQIVNLKKEVALKENMKQRLSLKLEKEKKARIKDNEKKDAIINDKDAIIKSLKEKIIELEKSNKKLTAKIELDGTTAGIPTSQTPINKRKVIPNTRVKSGVKIGGQVGHSKHKLKAFCNDEINENVYEEIETCPNCGSSDLSETTEEIIKDELDYEIKVIKKRHHFKKYECNNCHNIVKKSIPNNLKEENQYGNKVKAHALALTNIGNVPINKTRRIISGLTCNEINLSEGFISKLQTIASTKLNQFIIDLENYVVKLDIVHWDDTVIFVNTKRSCLRYYGDSTAALYKANETKGKIGLDEDNILRRIKEKQKVVHDHNKVNYNEEYVYINVECCEHLERDLAKVKLNITESEWAIKLKEHFSSWYHKRKENIKNNIYAFTDDETNDFMIEFDRLILLGMEENKTHTKSHYYTSEKALLNRLIKYRDNYTYWLYDYDIPYTNNESERSLRGVKTKLKVSGQFQNIKYARYYANIRSYIETCKRNGFNEYDALEKLLDDNPYTIEEIFKIQKDEEK